MDTESSLNKCDTNKNDLAVISSQTQKICTEKVCFYLLYFVFKYINKYVYDYNTNKHIIYINV